MNKIIFFIVMFTCMAGSIILTSCSDSEELMFNLEKPGVYFHKLAGQENIDSLAYSFVVSPASVVKDTLDEELRIRVMGQAAAFDREVNLVVEDSSTAIQGVHYDMPTPIILPANAFEVYVPLYVYRTEDLKEEIKSLYFSLKESEDFIVGYQGNSQHIITITDKLTRPSDWYGGLTDLFYGAYSIRKHEFMVQTLGTISITMGTGGAISQMMSFQQQMLVALTKYEAENGPMIDENGNQVLFPN
ncbi:DUF4843 domain-containing protein [Flavivirga sp. 57AJ16]|uniref:DUF4843 domain-containing protein n=1 Tax=Flavivirga sp. 57AJ16 TaxID=3025307 RepID=UPI00236673CF|nr:DUF4843 domain-containing protein [Flavivirga sp. 57AJ16]MDD7888020.1 DUF4843 domain-containing protein [Flavivirga sp. 57AJ16]